MGDVIGQGSILGSGSEDGEGSGCNGLAVGSGSWNGVGDGDGNRLGNGFEGVVGHGLTPGKVTTRGIARGEDFGRGRPRGIGRGIEGFPAGTLGQTGFGILGNTISGPTGGAGGGRSWHLGLYRRPRNRNRRRFRRFDDRRPFRLRRRRRRPDLAAGQRLWAGQVGRVRRHSPRHAPGIGRTIPARPRRATRIHVGRSIRPERVALARERLAASTPRRPLAPRYNLRRRRDLAVGDYRWQISFSCPCAFRPAARWSARSTWCRSWREPTWPF